METENPLTAYSRILEDFDRENRLRSIPGDRCDRPHIDMTSNDYLGLGKRWKSFMPEFLSRCQDASFSSSASRLLSERQKHHLHLESLLSGLYNKDVLLFNSGYHANVGIIQALAIPGTVFLCDKLIHASMIDGLALANAEYRRWRHNDTASLRKLLEKYADAPRCIVVVESIYSMDGDLAPLADIVKLKKLFPQMLLYLDEAHAFGTRGDRGLGVAEELGLIDDVDILIGTLGKAAASSGAFVATSLLLKLFFINASRSLIFSTAIPPVNAAWSELMTIEITGMAEERKHLAEISERFRKAVEEITGIPNNSRSHIVPLIVGDAEKAVRLAARLSLKGVEALPIRRPTVPEGGERLRFSLSAYMSDSQVDYVIDAVKNSFE